jgi:hypothetical protein
MSTKSAHTPTPLRISDIDVTDGTADIIIEHEGCPILTVRGTDGMSCIDEEDEPKLAAEVKATAEFVVTAYNSHQELLTRLYNLVNAVETFMSDPKKDDGVHLAIQDAEETLKRLEK